MPTRGAERSAEERGEVEGERERGWSFERRRRKKRERTR